MSFKKVTFLSSFRWSYEPAIEGNVQAKLKTKWLQFSSFFFGLITAQSFHSTMLIIVICVSFVVLIVGVGVARLRNQSSRNTEKHQPCPKVSRFFFFSFILSFFSIFFLVSSFILGDAYVKNLGGFMEIDIAYAVHTASLAGCSKSDPFMSLLRASQLCIPFHWDYSLFLFSIFFSSSCDYFIFLQFLLILCVPGATGTAT